MDGWMDGYDCVIDCMYSVYLIIIDASIVCVHADVDSREYPLRLFVLILSHAREVLRHKEHACM